MSLWSEEDLPEDDGPTVAALKRLTAELLEAREKHEAIKRAEKEACAHYHSLKAQVLNILEAADLRTFVSDECRVTAIDKLSVRVPKTEEEKRAFFGWCEEQGIFWELVSVNSNSLNAFYRAEAELAAARGVHELRIPGLDAPNEYRELRVQKR